MECASRGLAFWSYEGRLKISIMKISGLIELQNFSLISKSYRKRIEISSKLTEIRAGNALKLKSYMTNWRDVQCLPKSKLQHRILSSRMHRDQLKRWVLQIQEHLPINTSQIMTRVVKDIHTNDIPFIPQVRRQHFDTAEQEVMKVAALDWKIDQILTPNTRCDGMMAIDRASNLFILKYIVIRRQDHL
jgi:hypothetical protein